MTLRTDPYTLEQQIRKANAARADILGERQIGPLVRPPPSRLEFDALAREVAYQKESILMMSRALEQLADHVDTMPGLTTLTIYANEPNGDDDQDIERGL